MGRASVPAHAGAKPPRRRCAVSQQRPGARARRALSAPRGAAQVPHDQPARGGGPGRRARRGGQAALPGPAPRDEHPRLPVRLVPRRAVRGRAPRQRGGLCRVRLLHALHEPAAGQGACRVPRGAPRVPVGRCRGSAGGMAPEPLSRRVCKPGGACRQLGVHDIMRLRAAWHVG